MTLLTFAVAFMTGVFLAGRFDLPLLALGLFALASLLLGVLLVSARRSLLPAFLALALLSGMFRAGVSEGDQASTLTDYHGRFPVQVRGAVVSDPEPAGVATRLRLRVDGVKLGQEWAEVSGDVQVTLRESSEVARLRERPYFRYGDRLLLEGALESPPVLEGFDYPAYLARQGITSVMSFPNSTLVDEGHGILLYRWLYGARHRVADSLTRLVSEPQASVGQALLLGIRDNLPDELVEDFRATGTSHILAISGLHIGILLALSLGASQWLFGRRRHIYLLLPFALVWLYALVSGMSPSATRAAIMGSVYLAALLLGRPRSVLPALGFAAALMVAIDPDVLWSVAFQLSFAAMAGITLVMPLLGNGRARTPATIASTLLMWLLSAAAVTIAATLATLPLLAFYFERVSPVGILATLLVLPALPLTLVAYGMAGTLGLLGAWPAQLFGWMAWAAASYITGVVGLIARLPGASVEIRWIAPFMVWIYYGMFALFYVRKPLRRAASGVMESIRAPALPFAGRGAPMWALAPVIAIAALFWIAALSLPDSRLHVAFVDIGQGDAAFIATPGGQQIVVDGGPDPLELVRFLGDRMPFRDRTIELVVLTHAHSDHVNGLIEVLRRYDVRRILEREFDYDSPDYAAWRRAVADEGAEVIQAQSGQVIVLGDGVTLNVVNPPLRLLTGTSSDVDNASVVLMLVYGEVSFLLTGDMFHEAEAALVARDTYIDSDVLKVGHHGSRSSTTETFLDAASPAVAVISAGEDNRYGHPHPETMEALRQRLSDDMIFLTRDRGTVEFVTDGNRLEVKTER